MADIKVRVGQQNATKVISSLAGAQTLSLAELNEMKSEIETLKTMLKELASKITT